MDSAEIAEKSVALNVVLACASGTFLALAFPYPSLWPLAWGALIPLLFALSRCHPGTGFVTGYVFGLVFFGIVLVWSSVFGVELWAVFVAVESITFGVFGLAAAWFLRTSPGLGGWRPVAIASTWTLIEYLRMQGPYGLTWGQLSYSQLPFAQIVQIADLTGGIGVSFLVALVNAVLAELVVRWRQKPPGNRARVGIARGAIWSTGFVAGCLVYGIVRPLTLPARTSDASTIACVQTDIDPYIKFDPAGVWQSIKTLEDATVLAATKGAYLVVWPETAVPTTVLENPVLLARFQALAARLHVFILVGAPDRSPKGSIFNTAFMLSPNGALAGRYDKMHLVPFGEYLPLRWLLGGLSVFSPITVDLSAGATPYVFRTPRFTFGTVICFESTFSDVARTFVRAGAQMLLVITNDAWFLRTSAAEHHLAMSAMRAIEQRIWVIHCGNRGLSAFVDPLGHIQEKTELLQAALIAMAVQPGTVGTVYQRFGDWFVALLALVFVACVLAQRGLRSAPPSISTEEQETSGRS